MLDINLILQMLLAFVFFIMIIKPILFLYKIPKVKQKPNILIFGIIIF